MYYETGMFKKQLKHFSLSNQMLPNEKGFALFLAKSLYHSNIKVNQEKSINFIWNM